MKENSNIILSNALYPVCTLPIQGDDGICHTFQYRITEITDTSLKISDTYGNFPFLYKVINDKLYLIEINHKDPNLVLYTVPISDYKELKDTVTKNKIVGRFANIVREYKPSVNDIGLALTLRTRAKGKANTLTVKDVLIDEAIVISASKNASVSVFTRNMDEEVTTAIANLLKNEKYDPTKKFFGHVVLSPISGNNPSELILSTLENYV